MKPKKQPLTHPEHATLRLSLDVDRISGDRVADLIDEVRRVVDDEVAVVGLALEPVALELTGPRLVLEALRAKAPYDDGLRRVLGSWRMSFGPVSIAARPAPTRGRRVLVVDGDGTRARADVEVLARARIDACAVSSIDAAQALMQRSGLRFDAVVLRHGLADGDGLTLLERVGIEDRRCSVLVIDERVRPELARAYRLRGAFRYGGPPTSALQLVGRVNATMLDTHAWRGVEEPGAEAPGEPPRQLLDPEQGADRLKHVCQLSATERDVAVMVLLGLRDLEIAEKLGQSERTAKRYVGKVLEKAGIGNRASLWGVLHRDGLGAVLVREVEAEHVPASLMRPGGGGSPPSVRPSAPVSMQTTRPAA